MLAKVQATEGSAELDRKAMQKRELHKLTSCLLTKIKAILNI